MSFKCRVRQCYAYICQLAKTTAIQLRKDMIYMSKMKYGFIINQKCEVIKSLDHEFIGSKSPYWDGWVKKEFVTILDEVMHSGEQLYKIEYKITGGTKRGYVKANSIEYTIDGYKPTQIATSLKKTPSSSTRTAATFDASQVLMPYNMRYNNIGARYFHKDVTEENLPNYVGGRNNIELLQNIGEILYNKKWYQITAYYGEYYVNDNRRAFDHTAAIPNKHGSVYYPFKALHEGVDFVGAKDSEIYSITSGIVVAKDVSSYNYIMILDEANKKYVGYQHTASISEELKNKKYGDHVEVGMKLGIQGHAGMTRGDHVHLEVVDLTDTQVTLLKQAIAWKNDPANAGKDYYSHLKSLGFSIRTSKDQTLTNYSIYDYLEMVMPDRNKFTMEAGKTYKITNATNTDFVLDNSSSSSHTYSYEQVDAAGIYRFKGGTFGSLKLFKNTTTIISGDDAEQIALYLPKEEGDTIAIETIANPNSFRLTIDPGKNYKIVNGSTSSCRLENTANSDGATFDYVKKYQNSDDTFEMDTYANMTLNANGTLLLAASKLKPFIIHIPFNLISEIEVSNVPDAPLYKKTLEIGKSYQLLNTSNDRCSLKNTSSLVNRFDYVLINKQGDMSYSLNSGFQIHLNSLEKILMNGVSNKEITVYYPTAIAASIQCTELENPVLVRFNMEPGHNYEIVNESEVDKHTLKTTAGFDNGYEFVTINKEGNMSFVAETSGSPSLYAKEKMLLTGIDNRPILIFYPYLISNEISIKEVVDPPLKRLSLEAGDTYKFTNISENRGYTLKGNWNFSRKIDYVKQDKEGNFAYAQGASGLPKLNAMDQMIITAVDKPILMYYPYLLKDIIKDEKINEPALFKYTMDKDKNYEIKNLSNTKSYWVHENAESTLRRFDYVRFNEDGTYICGNKQYNIPLLYSNSRIIMNGVEDSSLDINFPYSIKDDILITEIATPALLKVTIDPDKSYEFENHSATKSHSLYDNTSSYIMDYVSIQADGDLSYNHKVSTLPSISPKGKLCVTNIGDKPLFIYYPYTIKDIVTATQVEHSALYKVTMEPDTHVEFENTSLSKSYDIRDNTSNGVLDYVKIKADGYNTFNRETSGLPNLLAQERMMVTCRGDKSVMLYIPYYIKDILTSKVTSNPALYEITMEPGKSYEFMNTSDSKTYSVKDNTSNSVLDYVKTTVSGNYIFNREVSIVSDLSAQEKMIVTCKDDKPVMLYIPYYIKDIVTSKEISNPALYEIAMEPGKSYEFKNTSDSKTYSIRDNTSNGVLDYVKTAANGYISTNSNTSSLPDLSALDKMTVTCKGNNSVIAYIPYAIKDILTIKVISE